MSVLTAIKQFYTRYWIWICVTGLVVLVKEQQVELKKHKILIL